MAFIGNLIWFILGGWLVGLMYLASAIILFPLLPFLLPLVGYSFWPFGRRPVSKTAIEKYKKANKISDEYEDKFLTASGTIKLLANVFWMPFGFLLALTHLLCGLLNFFACAFLVTIPVCLPNALAHFKLIRVAFAPFGIRLIETSLANDIIKAKAISKL